MYEQVGLAVAELLFCKLGLILPPATETEFGDQMTMK